MDLEQLDRARDTTLVENTAQSVFKHLDRLEDHRAELGNRWIWELLQNARDAAPSGGVTIHISLKSEQLAFSHNGVAFLPEEISHLIYHGSTKVDGDSDLDHFGSGFLSTHLLSRKVGVRGVLDSRYFNFTLDRSGATVDDLHQAMDESWEEFKGSLTADVGHYGWSTSYAYPLTDDRFAFAKSGVEQLCALAHVALAFCPEIRKIQIELESGDRSFATANIKETADGIEFTSVDCHTGHEVVTRHIAVARDADGLEVALPLSQAGDMMTVDLERETPRIFVVFPLVTTERLPIPMLVNSKRFKPREDRDGIELSGETERIRENRDLLDRSKELMQKVLKYAANSRWGGIERLLNFDLSDLPDWVDRLWLAGLLRDLTQSIRVLPLMATEDGGWIAPSESWVPFNEDPDIRGRLWVLLSSLSEGNRRLPTKEASDNWFDNLSSWHQLLEPEDLSETYTVERISRHVGVAGSLDGLAAELSGGDSTTWLDSLLMVILDAGQTLLFDENKVLPSQAGNFSKRIDLRYDDGIPDKLKDIARQLGRDLRAELLDCRPVLSQIAELLAPKTAEEALDELLEVLKRSCVDDSLRVEFVEPSIALFWWLVNSALFVHRLEGFPLATAEELDGKIVTTVLQRDLARAPLAPSANWPESARNFEAMFARRRVLNSRLSAPEDSEMRGRWIDIEQLGYVRSSPLFQARLPIKRFLVDGGFQDRDNETHRSISEVLVSDIAFLNEEDTGLVDAARKSKTRAVQLLGFVLCSALREDQEAFDRLTVDCECGQQHGAFKAAWLLTLRDRKWIPTTSGGTLYTSAESLAGLVDGQEDLIDQLGSDAGIALLEALSVSPSDFQMRVVANGERDRLRLVRSMSRITRAAGGDIDKVEFLASEIGDHPELFSAIEEGKARREKVSANQNLGTLVETLLKSELEAHGIIVHRTGIGSDFEIESDFIEGQGEVMLEIAGRGESLLVEVKSTRSDHVRMTPTQAMMATHRTESFALCVVPIASDRPTAEEVRRSCRFVFGIGSLLEKPVRSYHSVVDAANVARSQTGQIEVVIVDGEVRFSIGQTVWERGLRIDQVFGELSR